MVPSWDLVSDREPGIIGIQDSKVLENGRMSPSVKSQGLLGGGHRDLNLWVFHKSTALPSAAPLILSRIVGGWECEKHSQPWQVLVASHGRAVCGGVLVHPQWVLTAAHCIRKKSVILLGRHSLFHPEDTGQVFQVSHSFPHPLYNMSLLKNQFLRPGDDSSHDLMLLHLSEPAEITDAVKVMDLPTQEPALGSTCYASGWGSIEPQEFLTPKKLQCVDLHIISNDVCAQVHSQKVTKFMLCAGRWTGGKSTCSVSHPYSQDLEGKGE
ncbi:prostate-specific antigen isoform X3 [Symphalangus syndactylus]|uniref:prostate-specific antigen isoform X3 n=1 Tax=Symphalangus syndactylus TaxID=9590 RepID=UPI003007D04A